MLAAGGGELGWTQGAEGLPFDRSEAHPLVPGREAEKKGTDDGSR